MELMTIATAAQIEDWLQGVPGAGSRSITLTIHDLGQYSYACQLEENDTFIAHTGGPSLLSVVETSVNSAAELAEMRLLYGTNQISTNSKEKQS